jgi:hypothetical protein
MMPAVIAVYLAVGLVLAVGVSRCDPPETGTVAGITVAAVLLWPLALLGLSVVAMLGIGWLVLSALRR